MCVCVCVCVNVCVCVCVRACMCTVMYTDIRIKTHKNIPLFSCNTLLG